MADFFKRAIDTVTEDVKELGDYLTEKGQGTKESAERMQDSAHSRINEAKNEFDAKRDTTADATNSMADRIRSDVDQAKSSGQSTNSRIDKSIDDVQQKSNDMLSDASNKWESGRDRVAESLGNFRDEVENTASHLQQGLKDTGATVKDRFNSAWNAGTQEWHNKNEGSVSDRVGQWTESLQKDVQRQEEEAQRRSDEATGSLMGSTLPGNSEDIRKNRGN
uniref:Uncharacterized protein n=1 Tax=Polytomella parva TaxID=51329 RepID=A0A7S0VK46_9CHLO|mmetsp:Transcript_34994/g.62920  ORF Transcript_34994/g.62920 Transcript_34994/m.62920 type:complete len:221 (+) Transcript_34994:279-941(+)|eukprot:CAMPEP_0175047814 /NCGR_PEP_ID=MMETSP0052_2-20121109/5816_1 /TAXON_ID=51329 ORGANISM="Polytomella parva, Strain SAG 63-3" /NCGR_SAMPLE_ID=MMETSP0052_2 /ASSEMBLY_ACC=CAM_ASM_000194 /LENGTH=220 /DNA_ID=CAMNT_0016311755 /DNA_START=186 /DNA_END=848 /DNA_ORIENTATION=+